MAVHNLGEDCTAAAGRGTDELGHVDPARKRPYSSYHVRPSPRPRDPSSTAAAAATAAVLSHTVVVLGNDDGRPAIPAIPAGASTLLDEVTERPGQADVDNESYVGDIDPGA